MLKSVDQWFGTLLIKPKIIAEASLVFRLLTELY